MCASRRRPAVNLAGYFFRLYNSLMPERVTTGEPARTSRPIIKLRTTVDEREMIDRAAAVLGKNRSQFMLEVARQAAENALLDRVLLRVGRALVRDAPCPAAPTAPKSCRPNGSAKLRAWPGYLVVHGSQPLGQAALECRDGAHFLRQVVPWRHS